MYVLSAHGLCASMNTTVGLVLALRSIGAPVKTRSTRDSGSHEGHGSAHRDYPLITAASTISRGLSRFPSTGNQEPSA